MRTQAISNVENRTSKPHYMLSAGIGAAMGAGARYIMPTKNEITKMVNKDAVDEFVSSAARKTRGANRSILKYAGVGALIAAGISVISRALSQRNVNKQFEYSKYAALMDTPADSAYAVMWYGDKEA